MCYKSHVVVIASTQNSDQNSINDIAAAIGLCSATDLEICPNGVIEATVPTGQLDLIGLIEGVKYVRSECTYLTV